MIKTLKTFTNMRDALAALDSFSEQYLKENRKKETVSLTVASHTPMFAGGKRLKVTVETVEVRMHYTQDQETEAQWFIKRAAQ